MGFSEFGLILISTVLVNNFVLAQFLGLCPFMGVSGRLENSIGLSFATGFVLTLSALISYLCHHYLLVPFGATYLQTLVFIVVVAIAVQATEIIVRFSSPLLHERLGIFLPLITSNCAVLGVALINVRQEHGSILSATIYGFGASLGFSLVLILFATLRERLAGANIPLPFKGIPIALITAGILSMAFMGFSGFIRP